MAGFDITDNKNEIVCPSCGGHFSEREPKCPFCGNLNPVGAEEEYMGKLYSIKERVEHLPDLAQDQVEENLISNSKRIVRFVGVILLILFITMVLFTAIGKRDEKNAMKEYREKEAFKEAYFPEFNRLYEEGKDDELLELTISLYGEPGYEALYNWEHYNYLDFHHDYIRLKEWEELYYEEGDIEDLSAAIYDALLITRENYYLKTPGHVFSEKDKEKIEGYQAYAEEFLQKHLGMKSEEIDSLVKELKGDKGYIPHSQITKYLKENNKG